MSRASQLFAVVLLAGGGAWMALKFAGSRTPREVSPGAVAGIPARTGNGTPAVSAPREEAGAASELEREIETNVAKPPPLELSTTGPAWEEQLKRIAVDSTQSETAKARAILALLPALPEEAQAAAAELAVIRLPDADYAAVVLPVAVNPLTHGQAMGVLFADLMERPDAITLPALLSIARNPEHPFAPSARDNLELLLHADFGADWKHWEAAMDRALPRPPR